jgi:hypothetical protein
MSSDRRTSTPQRAHDQAGPDAGLATIRRWDEHPVPVRRVAALATALAAVVVVAGCAGEAGGAAAAPASLAAPPAASVGGAGAGAPNPNAPEINPAGDIPDSQVFVPYVPPGGGFTVSVPQGWSSSQTGGATVFTDKFNSVRVESSPATAPTPESVRAHDVPVLQAQVSGFALGDVVAAPRPAGPAVLMTYTAASPPDPVTGKSVTEAVERYTFWRAGQQAVLTLSGPKGADNVDPWRKITDSFRWQQ